MVKGQGGEAEASGVLAIHRDGVRAGCVVAMGAVGALNTRGVPVAAQPLGPVLDVNVAEPRTDLGEQQHKNYRGYYVRARAGIASQASTEWCHQWCPRCDTAVTTAVGRPRFAEAFQPSGPRELGGRRRKTAIPTAER